MPCLTTNQIVEIREFLNQVTETLKEWAEPGSRFYELDAYSFLGSFLPCGRVPKADDEIFAANQRIEDIAKALSILAQAKDEEEQPPDEGEGDDDNCEELIVAINNLSAKLDLTTTINNALNAFIPILVAALNPKFVDVNTNIDESTTRIIGAVVSVTNNVNLARDAISDTRTELREARERLIVIQGANKDVEILERIHDTRTELREARERLIRVEDCVCPRVEGGTDFDVDDLILRLMAEINAALDKQAILIFDSLYDQIILMEGRLNVKIDNPNWLAGINAKLDTIIRLLDKLDQIINFLRDLDLYIRTNLDRIALDIKTLINIANNIDANVSSVITALSLLRSIVNEIDNNIDIVRNLVNQLTTISNNILNQVQNISNQNNNNNTQVLLLLGQIISTLNALNNELDRLQPPILSGSIVSSGCLAVNSYAYGGNGFIGLSSQITSLSSQINNLHSELCPTITNNDEVLQGELVTIDCETPDSIIRTPYSGSGLQVIMAGLEVQSNNTLAMHREICKKKEEEPNCFIVMPSDVDEELNIPRQLVIHWKVDDENIPIEDAHWSSTIPLPISGLDWETHFESLRWVRGNVVGRWYLQNSTSRLGGYFNTEQDALNTLNQLIQLTTLQPKTPLPRITRNSSTFITSIGLITKPYKVVLADKVGNKIVPIACYTPNN